MERDTRSRRPPKEASGRFVLRLSRGLHAALRAAAREAGVSLNDYCARKLATRAGDPASPEASAVVERAAALFGEHLLGVVVYGSWVRGEATASSDVDVLVVLDAGAPLTRALYRQWDAEPVTWEGRPVEPHFVRLHGSAAPATGLWAEAALEGVVLFERGFAVSRRLAAVRGDVVAGRLVRRLAHGQPYWAEVA
jgi:HicB family/Nucleotidyltransferase domain